MKVETMQQEEQCILAVKKADVRFHYNGTRKVTYIALTTNKITELKINGLLTEEALEKYTHICILYKDKKIVIPILQGSWQTHQSTESTVLRVKVAENVKIYMNDIDNWHNIL
ncbi:TPA: hypothetical protein IUX93_002814 [Enterococcus faecalis]|nr:hypothetical protein [Enterococcus faecalis]HAP4915481.1 hypothetical protein [Enterococcus faecalis]HAP4921457.1 hypothetical protein [Enterococcus faecalis]